MKKAVFFDVDGTIWDFEFKIPKSTREAIGNLKKNGHDCFICTGRTKDYIRNEDLLSLGFQGIVGGCGTYGEYNGEVLFYYSIEKELLKRTVEALKGFSVPVILEGCCNHFLDIAEFKMDPYLKILQKELGDHMIPLTGNEEKWEASKLTIGIENIPIQEVFSFLEKDFSVICHGTYIAEVVPRGKNKATGIAQTCEMLGISREHTYAFGDSSNDLEMLDYVKYGVAMGNGTAKVKEAADYVTTPIHEDGIKNALKYYNLI